MFQSCCLSSPTALHPAANPLPRDPAPPVDYRARLGRPLRVRWEADLSSPSDEARIHREFCLGLLAADDVELALIDPAPAAPGLAADPRFAALFARRGARLSGPVDVTIRHQSFPNWRRPEAGKLVVMQPWAHGHLPREWVRGALAAADEVWAPSRFTRDVYVRSGVPAEKVRLMPPGFDPALFTPEGSCYALPAQKSRRFLFVGPAREAEGLDLLLGAYQRAFAPDDDVCLVVQLTGPREWLDDPILAARLHRAAADPRLPQILLLEDDLAAEQRAALYRACCALVLPYRGVAFGLSVLEGMACGQPMLVTAGGPTDDYVDDGTGWRLPYHQRSAGGYPLGATVGPYECAGDPWHLEPDREALVAALRQAYDDPAVAAACGEAAAAAVRARWTWEQSIAQLRARLIEVVIPPTDPPFIPATPWEPKETGRRGDGATGRAGEGAVAHGPAFDVAGPPVSPSPRPSVPSVPPLAPSPTRPVELSLCMIVRDEEPRLPKCLESIRPYVDEIVVVDTGSTDGTRAVARHFGARVFDLPWPDSFAIARNQSLDLARGDWILRMDADDVIAPEHGAQLRELIRRYPDRSVAYTMEYRVPPGPGGTGEHVVDQVQLWPNRPDLRFEHRLHEQMLPAVGRAGLYVVASGLSILHQHFDWSPAGQERRRLRDFRLLELDLRDHPDHPFVLFNLGMTHLYTTREYEVAAHYLRRSLDRSDWQDSIVRLTYDLLAAARIGQGDWAGALAVNEEGRRCYPEDAGLLLQAGQIYEQLGRVEEARRCLERLLLGYDERHYRCADDGLRTYRGRDALAGLLRRLGQTAHAEQILREVVRTYPFYLPAQLHLAEAIYAQGRPDEARALLAQVPEVEAIQHELQQLRTWVGMS